MSDNKMDGEQKLILMCIVMTAIIFLSIIFLAYTDNIKRECIDGNIYLIENNIKYKTYQHCIKLVEINE